MFEGRITGFVPCMKSTKKVLDFFFAISGQKIARIKSLMITKNVHNSLIHNFCWKNFPIVALDRRIGG